MIGEDSDAIYQSEQNQQRHPSTVTTTNAVDFCPVYADFIRKSEADKSRQETLYL